jgi:hypothetical protein
MLLLDAELWQDLDWARSSNFTFKIGYGFQSL